MISNINISRDKKLINLLLFIDFKKAFDTVDSNLLLTKLFYYGFDNSSLSLLSNYFKARKQFTKLGNVSSEPLSVKLGVPQGSILGPLFFLIFINDLPLLVKDLDCKLFADDTTFYHSEPSLNHLIREFTDRIKPLFVWCSKNRIDINYSKTYCMFITNKRVVIPNNIELNGHIVEVVDKFKLLGITIDNKLNFRNHVADLSMIINTKLFSIKRLF